ncbi:hypothetical protein X734_19020 [Mesorhizobium sp. L2C084A000]|nr:hypothetical protein X734_19020 [Mesorhizobium sp. L2C084A000]
MFFTHRRVIFEPVDNEIFFSLWIVDDKTIFDKDSSSQ